MANNKNLKPIRSKDEAREKGKKGGKKSGESRREKRKLKDELELLLSIIEKDGKTIQENLCLSLINQAKKGNVRAFEVLRDTIGERPTQQHEIIDKEKMEAVQKEIEEALFSAKNGLA